MIELPASPEAFRDAAWDDILPYYEQLATLALESTSTVIESWLSTWSRLDTLVGEAGTLAMIAYTGNTADTAAETAYLRFSMEIFPKLEEQGVRLAKRLIDLDDELLADAQRELNTTGVSDTVRTALKQATARSARARQVTWLREGGLAAMADPARRDEVWR